MSTEQLVLQGTLKGHNGWVTAIATNTDFPDLVISASRDKSIIVWKIARDQTTGSYGVAQRRLVGHNHFIQDLALTSDNKNSLYALTGSWDGSLRLWDVQTGASKLRFSGHAKDVLSVAFSSDNRQIVSGSRDKSIKVWNTLGRCKYTISGKDSHKEWVSCVRFSPNVEAPTLVSAGWDKIVKVWNMTDFTNKFNLVGHTGYVNTVTVSPDGSLCASGGKDGTAMLWDINEGKHLYSLEASEVINTLVFSPIRYWLCAATASSIIIWDLESKVCLDTVKLVPEGPVGKKTLPVQCTSLCWSQDGNVLYAGYSDNVIRAYQVSTVQN